MKKTRFFLYTFLSLSLLFLMASLFYNFWSQKKNNLLELLPLIDADMQLGSVHFTETAEGVKKWDLAADDVQYFKDKEMVFLKGIKASYFPKSSAPIVIESKEGHFDSGSGDLEVFGDVKVTYANGGTLYTDSLKYNVEEELVSTDAAVILKDANNKATITGKGLLLDIEEDRLIVLDEVDAKFYGNPFNL